MCSIAFRFAATCFEAQVTSYLPKSWLERERLCPVEEKLCSMNYASPETYMYIFYMYRCVCVHACTRVCTVDSKSMDLNCKGPFIYLNFFSPKYSIYIFILYILIFLIFYAS